MYMPEIEIVKLPEIVYISSYPPRECGIATYTHDLIKAMNNKFHRSFEAIVCALEKETNQFVYPEEVKYVINTSDSGSFMRVAKEINENEQIEIIMLQHEFGFFN